MNTTLAPEIDQHGIDIPEPDASEPRVRRPAAVALVASVEAVRDALTHMDDDAVLAVPVGTPHENFDVVEWCASHRKPVINRFDPWPLETLLVQNAPTDAPDDVDEPAGSTDTSIDASGEVEDTSVRGRIGRVRRHIRRRIASGDRSLEQGWHGSGVADARARMSPGVL